MDGPYSEESRIREEGCAVYQEGQRDKRTESRFVQDGGPQGTEERARSDKPLAVKDEPQHGRCQANGVGDQLLVLATCCMASSVALGTAFGLGSGYLDIINTFNTSRSLAAMVQSLCVGIGVGAGGLVTGPVVGQVGGAMALMAGGLLCCVGCVGSSFAPNIYVLIVCFGGLTGMGVSSCFMAVYVVIGTTFQKRRHLALSIVALSGGLGDTVFPSLVRWLVDEYTLRGMFLILAGICLHCVLFGVVVKTFGTSGDLAARLNDEVEWVIEETETIGQLNDREHAERESGSLNPDKDWDGEHVQEHFEDMEMCGFTNEDGYASDTQQEQDSGLEGEELGPPGQQAIHFQQGLKKTSAEASFAEDTAAAENKGLNLKVPVTNESVNERCQSLLFTSVNTEKEKSNSATSTFPGNLQTESAQHTRQNENYDTRSKLHRPSVVSISEKIVVWGSANTAPTLRKMAESQRRPSTGRKRLSSTPRLSITGGRRWSVVETLQPDLLHNIRYVLFTLSYYSAFLVPNTIGIFITDMAEGRGLSVEQRTQLLPVIYGCSLAGRTTIVLLQVRRQISALRLCGFASFCCGLASFGFTLIDYIGDGSVLQAYIAACAVFGWSLGLVVTCAPLACAELVGVHQYAPALGYQFFVAGLATSIGGPLGGLLKDTTGSYNPLLYLGTALGTAAAAVVVGVICRSPRSRARAANSVKNDRAKGDNRFIPTDANKTGFVEPKTMCTSF